MSILDRIIILLKENHKTQKDLCDYLGVKKNAFTDWKGGRSESYKKYLPEIAEFLGVSVGYLTGKTDIKKELTALTDDELTNEIIRKIISLPPNYQLRVIDYINGLIDSKD